MNCIIQQCSVVRVAPNELSFNTANSWRDIYSVRKNVDPFIKSEFYDGGSFAADASSIVSERDPKSHVEMRKSLASAFSDRSLKAQEPLIADIVDRFVERVGKVGQRPPGADMVVWYNLVTFDIIGSLAFGQDFGGLESGTEHFWVSIVSKSLRLEALLDCFRRFPAVATVFLWLFSGLIDNLLKENNSHRQYTMDMTIVCTSPFAACMGSANFKDPWEFKPERWLGQNVTDDLEASQPFSLGPRSCMGRSLGWLELQTIMAKMLFRYDLELVNDLDWHRDSQMHTLWEKPSLMVRVLSRQHSR